MKTTRNGAGAYHVTISRIAANGATVAQTWIVNKVAELRGEWVAYLDSRTALDPEPTLSDVKAILARIDGTTIQDWE